MPGIFNIIWKLTEIIKCVTDGYVVAVCQAEVVLRPRLLFPTFLKYKVHENIILVNHSNVCFIFNVTSLAIVTVSMCVSNVKSVLYALLDLADNFPRHEPQNADLQQQLSLVRAKFKQVSQ